jgi:DegV family protein with EDD domain
VPLSAENTAVVLDSTADLPDPRARHPNWRLVPLYVRFGAETFREYVDISEAEFYRRLRESPDPPKSSQPSPADFQQAFESLSEFEHVLCVTLSAKISGTYESARLAAENTGDGRVRVLDSGVTSGGTVILADAIQRRLEQGTDDAEVEALVERFRRERGLLFTVNTLEYLIRGGRIGKAAGLAGQLLSVKPILVFDDGEVAPFKRVRGRGKAIAELESIFVEGSEDSPDLHVGVGHAEAPEDAEQLVKRVQAARPSAKLDILTTLGPVIGTHGGPGTLGLFWFQDS